MKIALLSRHMPLDAGLYMMDGPLALAENSVPVWRVELDPRWNEQHARWYANVLSAVERRRCDRFAFEKDRAAFVASRVLLRTTLSKYAEHPPEEWEFEATSHGKPHVRGPASIPPLRFSLTHTDGLAVVAVSRGFEVGVDAESVLRKAPLDLAQRYFSSEEAAHLSELPEDQRGQTFFVYWTLKEAYIKARGEGLSIPLKKFTFLLDGQRPNIAFASGFADDPSDWQFYLPPVLESRHQMAVAIASAQNRPVEFEMHSADLDEV